MTGSTIKKSTTEKRIGGADAPTPPHVRTRAQTGQHEEKERPGQGAFQTPQDRTEPSWGEPSAPPGISAAPYGSEDSAFTAQMASPKRKSLRLMLMAAIFVIGAGAGLIGAWWINEPSVMRIDPRVETSGATQVVTIRKPAENQSANKVRGINPSELPYDGAAPPDEPETTPAPTAPSVAKRQSPRIVPPLVETEPKPAAKSESSGASVGEVSKAESGTVAEIVPPPAVEQRIGLAEPASGMEVGNAQSGADKPPPQAEAIAPKPALKAASAAKDSESTKAKVTPKRTAPTRSAKDREIERIRQQAEDELKKKPDSGRTIGRSRTNQSRSAKLQQRKEGAVPVHTASASERHVRSTLAQCERAPNIFRREQCKWRICGGAWGKNGCPYYPPHVSSSY